MTIEREGGDVDLTKERACQLVNARLQAVNYPGRVGGPDDVSDLPSGRFHHNKLVGLGGENLVLRWVSPGTARNDVYFGGSVSIKREARILELARTRAGLPASEVIDVDEQSGVLLVREVPGITLHASQILHSHSLRRFLGSVQSLGSTLARAHAVRLDSFGSIQPEGIVPGLSNYSRYLEQFLSRHFKDSDALWEQYYTPKEAGDVSDYIGGAVREGQARFSRDSTPPCLVLYDLHDQNFLVDEEGMVSGLFDLEFSQAGHPSMEMGSISPQILGYYPGHVEQVRAAFLRGYGSVAPTDQIDNRRMEEIHVVNSLLSWVSMYHGVPDGIRNGWSRAFAEMALAIARGESMNHWRFSLLINQARKRQMEPILS